MSIKEKATECAAWAKQRVEVFAESGAPVPEPVRRLLELSEMVVSAPAAEPAASVEAPEVGEVRKALGVQPGETLMVAMRRRLDASRDEAVQALRDTAKIVEGVAKTLADGRVAGRREPAPDAKPAAPAPIELHHGMVLVAKDDGRRVAISQPARGAFVAQIVGADGALSAPRQIVQGNEWTLAQWMIVASQVYPGQPPSWEVSAAGNPKSVFAQPAPPIVDATPATQTTIAGTVPEVAPAAPKGAKIGAWAPDAVDIAKHTATLTSKFHDGAVDEIRVRALVAQFKTEKADIESQRPGVAFFHWAVKALTPKAT